MATIPPTVASSLRVDVNRSPIAYITIPSTLEKLEVTLDIEFSPTSSFCEVRERVASIVRPPRSEVGVLSMSGKTVTLSECRDIQVELRKKRTQYPEITEWYYDELSGQGFIHTIQVPVQALHQAEFITADQLEKMSSFVRANLQRS